MTKENRVYVFLATIGVLIVIFLNADKLWDSIDENITPYFREDEVRYEGSGSADASIRNIQIAWDNGNVTISYAAQNRISWKETFTKGKPTQFSSHQYWMNTETLYINYYSQEYGVMMPKTRHEISKDLNVFIPEGLVLNEVIVRCGVGEITCDVKANKIDTKSLNATCE